MNLDVRIYQQPRPTLSNLHTLNFVKLIFFVYLLSQKVLHFEGMEREGTHVN